MQALIHEIYFYIQIKILLNKVVVTMFPIFTIFSPVLNDEKVNFLYAGNVFHPFILSLAIVWDFYRCVYLTG